MADLTPGPELDALRTRLRTEAARIETDPQTNSIFALARHLFLELEQNGRDLAGLDSLIDEIHLHLADQRAEALATQHHLSEDAAIWSRVEGVLGSLADQGWEAFRSALETDTGGIVFTAHPTFALSQDARIALAAHAEHNTSATRTALAAAVSADSRDWSASISLTSEHEEVQAVLARAQSALKAYTGICLATARARFSDQWRTLRPVLPSLASWVGYDLDGRTDIDWWQSVALRLQEKAAQLSRYASDLAALANGDPDRQALADRLERASALAATQADAFDGDLSDPDRLIAAATALQGGGDDRLTSLSPILETLDGWIVATDDADDAARLLTLRSLMAAVHLGTARIHLRVNAAQVRAVIRRDLGLETEDRDLGRLALQKLSRKAAEEPGGTAGFADLFLEQSTARRQIMMCALWLQHIDADSPIRFLIAEVENPATIMGTVWLARQYGVDGMIDISPLFETPEALESGGRFMARLLQEPEFVRYVQGRGYLSIQLGFSDAGRFIGQVAANMAIERIHNLVIRALAKTDSSLDLLIFNTHGESMGRGAWPGSFPERFHHALTDWTHHQAATQKIGLRHEVSFQGGDGFLHFASPALAETTLAAWSLDRLSPRPDPTSDPFYLERDFVWDVYRSLRVFHERLFNDPDYGRLLSDFAPNFLVRAGSRQKRRTGGPTGPRALRAISHNATLQQLGVPVNTAGGMGSAIRRETERLIALINRSPRMQGLVRLALTARTVTSLPALRAYARVFDPSFWVAVSRYGETEKATGYRRVYYSISKGETYQSIRRIADRLSLDLNRFDRLLAELDETPSAEERHEGRLDLHILHAIRQSLMMHALALAGRLPTLSGRHDVSLDDFMGLILEMRLGEAAGILARAFPRSAPILDKLEPLSANPEGLRNRGYDQLHADVITPLREIDRLFHKTTLAVAQAYRAFG